MRNLRLFGLAMAIWAVLAVPLFGQEDGGGGFGFGLDLGIGAQTFNEPGAEEPVTYQSIALNPDFSIGPFGIGLAVVLNYRFNGGENNDEFVIRKEDWIPVATENKTLMEALLELYLPKFRYVRWGLRGDPLYIKLGSIDDATLGNGFIMGNYANTLFLPELRVFGLNFDLDGRLFKFPYVGMQSFIGNLAHFDVIGTRLYTRPLIWLDVPIIKSLEVGTTVAADVDPYYHLDAEFKTANGLSNDPNPVVVWGADFRLPILSSPIVSLAGFGDIVTENGNVGGMLGLGGRLFSFLPYGAQIRFLGDNFIPVYFGATYDLYRYQYYQIVGAEETVMPGWVGWYASTGFSVLDDQIAFHISLDGPFGQPADENDGDESDDWINYPHLRGVFIVEEGLLPGFSFEASYDKKNITSFADLVDASDAVIGAAVNYKTGPAVITLSYDVRYNPEYDPNVEDSKQWETTAKLESEISLF